MNKLKVKAKIISTFDLGYFVALEDGREGQLRALEIKPASTLYLQINKCE